MTGDLHQASCVAIGGRAVLIEGPPGAGKSSLALALIDRGAQLVGDDGVMLAVADGGLWAHPPPNITGLLEIRNVGLVHMPCVAAPVALAIVLDESAPRQFEKLEATERGGVSIPVVRLYPHSPVLALRAEHALALYGTA